MRRFVLAALAGAALTALATGSFAIAQRGGDRGSGFKASLNGYHEVVGQQTPSSGSVSTTGHGTFRASVRGNTIHYVLEYEDMEGGDVTQAHIHFAERHVGGGVIAFLCGGSKPPCTEPNGRFEGDIAPGDIIGPTSQGIEPGSMAEVIRAMRNGAVYVNVHSSRWGMGEIRGQVRRGLGRGGG